MLTTPITAQFLFISFIADVNIVFDWLFYMDNKDSNLVKPEVIGAVLCFAILGSLTWMAYATHGISTVAACWPCIYCYRQLFGESSLMPIFIQLWFTVVMEIVFNDVPMMILSTIVDTAKARKFTAAGEMSALGALNVATSAFDILAKLAEAIDNYLSIKKESAKAQG